MRGGQLNVVRLVAAALGGAFLAIGGSPGTSLALGDEVRSISAGTDHACATRTDGSAWCWGLDYHGELGDDSTVESGGALTCAVRPNRMAWCWGRNGSGDLGIGSVDEDPHPEPVHVLFP